MLIAAAQAVATPHFNLSGIQATTNPAAVWLIVNGPVAARLGVNGAGNCLGPGHWANAALGRGLRLILQNIGGALPGEMDRATHGQPGKYTFCCAENEEAHPWQPLHIERGFAAGDSTVTVVGAEGTMNMNTHAKSAAELARVIAETMVHPPSNEYVHGGEPWFILGSEHAEIFRREGWDKMAVRRALWEQSKMAVKQLSAKEIERARASRTAELGELSDDTLLPVSPRPEDIHDRRRRPKSAGSTRSATSPASSRASSRCRTRSRTAASWASAASSWRKRRSISTRSGPRAASDSPWRPIASAATGCCARSRNTSSGRSTYETYRVLARTPFRGRPRMGLRVSSSGNIIYIHTAGNTIDLYDAATFKPLRTITLDGDMSG